MLTTPYIHPLGICHPCTLAWFTPTSTSRLLTEGVPSDTTGGAGPKCQGIKTTSNISQPMINERLWINIPAHSPLRQDNTEAHASYSSLKLPSGITHLLFTVANCILIGFFPWNHLPSELLELKPLPLSLIWGEAKPWLQSTCIHELEKMRGHVLSDGTHSSDFSTCKVWHVHGR